MQLILRIFVASLGVLFSFIIFYFLIKRRINERNSLLWFFGALVILGLSLMPKNFDKISHWLGVDYPPALLYLVAILAVLMILLHQSIIITELQKKSIELAQALALVESERERGKKS